jgi:cyclophilin family peptidyl-prolyl cis-trans isomerase
MKKFLLCMLCTLAVWPAMAKKINNSFVTIETSMGSITVEVYADVTKHAENFLKLAKEGFYDSLLFHRVIPGFMIQGGDPDSKRALDGQMLGNGDIGYKIPAEFMLPKYYHKKGALAAARDNNPQMASSGCQFYLVVGRVFSDSELDMMESRTGTKYTPEARQAYRSVGGTPHLDGSYTVFGQVVKGLEVVDAIGNAPRNASDRPVENIRILRVTVKKKP